MKVEGNEPVDELASGIGKMLADLSQLIGQVTESTIQFKEGSRLIAEDAPVIGERRKAERVRAGNVGFHRNAGPILQFRHEERKTPIAWPWKPVRWPNGAAPPCKNPSRPWR